MDSDVRSRPRVPVGVDEDLVVFDRNRDHALAELERPLLEHNHVFVVDARALREHEQRRLGPEDGDKTRIGS